MLNVLHNAQHQYNWTIYTRKEIEVLYKFHEKFYIPVIQKLEFNLPHVRILGTYHCGKERRESFNLQGELWNILCQLDYTELVVSIFLTKPNTNTMV